MRFPLYPSVDAALLSTLAKFGIQPYIEFTDAEKEMAERFNVSEAIEDAIALRDAAGLTKVTAN